MLLLDWVKDELWQSGQNFFKNCMNNRLSDAAEYALLLGGKRIRPLLIAQSYQSLTSCSIDDLKKNDKLKRAMLAIEMIHTYSLIHDDLPAMDNDDFRRGKPSCHRAFDEPTAILAGDLLQSFAFELVFDMPEVIKLLSTQAQLMCFGQMLDLQSEHHCLSLDELEQIHRLKTGALIRASILIGYELSGHNNQQIYRLLADFSDALGLAFQVQDDILDVMGSSEILGKQTLRDMSLGKSTYVQLLGVQGAIDKLSSLHHCAIEKLSLLNEHFAFEVEELKKITDFIAKRNH